MWQIYSTDLFCHIPPLLLLFSPMNISSSSSSSSMSEQAFDQTIHALFKQSTSTPIYHVSSASLLPFISDLHLSLAATFAVYWIASFIFEAIDWSGLEMFERHRIHEPEEIKSRNRVTKTHVVKMVLLQQAIQTALGLICLPDEHEALTMNDARESMVLYTKRIAMVLGSRATMRLLSLTGKEGIEWLYWWGVPIAQFFFASYVVGSVEHCISI